MKKGVGDQAAAARAKAIEAAARRALREDDLAPADKKAALAALGQKLWQLGFELRDPAQGQLAPAARQTYERLASLAASVDRDLAPALAEAFRSPAQSLAQTLAREEQAAIQTGRKRLHGPEGEHRQRLVDRFVRSVEEEGGRLRAVLDPDVPQWALGDVLVGLAALHPDAELLVCREGAPAQWALRRGAVLSLR